MDGSSPSVSVVIPVFNSEQSLTELCERLIRVLDQEADAYEIILVNDASRDGSWDVVRRLVADHPCIHGIDLMRNYGQHNALLAGIRAATCEVTVTMDDDLQHPPEELPVLLRRLDEDVDVVYGTPHEEQHGLWRDLASKLTKLALKSAMDVDIARSVGPFRAFRTHLREAFSAYGGPFPSLDVLLTWGSSRFAAVQVRNEPRTQGASNYTFRKLTAHALNMMTGFSVLPLQVASMVGLGFTLLGGAILVYVVAGFFLAGRTVPGFTFLASSITIFSGAQLFALGVIGEYIARMHFRLMDRPTYAVRRSCTHPMSRD